MYAVAADRAYLEAQFVITKYVMDDKIEHPRGEKKEQW